MDKFAAYHKTLFELDKRGHVPIERSDAADAKLTDLLLSTSTQERRDDERHLAAAAIDAYYKERPISLCTLLHAQEELERSREGRVFIFLDSSVSALVCETAAAASAIAGVYEIAALCAATGTYYIYKAYRVLKGTGDKDAQTNDEGRRDA